MELEILYHGTKFKYNADNILKNGFNKYSYFARDLSIALSQGGKYVFEVVFFKKDLPDYWQVRCTTSISQLRILEYYKVKSNYLFINKALWKKVDDILLETCVTKPYCFDEDEKALLSYLNCGQAACI